MRQRIGKAALRRQHAPKIVAVAGILGRQLHCLLQVRRSLLEIPRVRQNHAQTVLPVRRARLRLEGVVQQRNRVLRVPALRRQQIAQVHLRRRVIGINPQRVHKMVLRIFQFP